MITRHILTLPGSGRRVHYRRCGSGPALLMVHQSPRSGAEYEPLMQRWGANFTCIAPDTPGFGQSDPLPGKPEIGDFADALGEFVTALGLHRCAAYGFHSGGIILVTALKRRSLEMSCLAVGGYAVWTAEEMALFGEHYLPEFHPSAYGEHLVWLWNRMLEQSWFFPWFDTRDAARLPVAHADLDRVQQAVMEMLDAGNAYQAGYGAVLRAPRDIPPPDSQTPPVLITAYDGDPLQAHLARLGPMPAGWEARAVATAMQHQDESLAFLRRNAGDAPCPAPSEDAQEGWLPLDGGLIHWRGTAGARHLTLHPPGGELSAPAEDEVAIDLPGHGHSSRFEDVEETLRTAMAHLDAIEFRLPEVPVGDPAQLYPDLAPERSGAHLLRAWSAARAEAIFRPWYAAGAANAVPISAEALEPTAIALRARARLRAGAEAHRWHQTLMELQGGGNP